MACTIMSTLLFKISIFFPYSSFYILAESSHSFIPNSKKEKNEQRLNSGHHDRHRFQTILDLAPISLFLSS